MLDAEEIFNWKVNLLSKGCRLDPNFEAPPSIALKKIHLYSHSHEKYESAIPDDLILSDQSICRIRYRSDSHIALEKKGMHYQIRNTLNDETLAAHFVPRPAFANSTVSNLPLSSICALLGTDLLGITPSNYCFYFQQNKQCRFCEILPTFKSEVEYPRAFKNRKVIEESVISALSAEERLRFIAMTTGNIHSYDATVDFFVEVGESLQKYPSFQKTKQVLATLMPPDDLSKISALREKGFTKVYFPLEVFDPDHFHHVCPGKADYGYEKILKALETAVQIFGRGNVYTNFVYGIQSLNRSLEPSSYDPQRENDLSFKAVTEMLSLSVIPAFTLYHFGGYNAIGSLKLDTEAISCFFKEWGNLVRDAEIVPNSQEAVLFGPLSLSNTLFNDGYLLAQSLLLPLKKH
jgi:hypothetical protein